MVFSSYMKRSLLYPLPLSTLDFLMGVLDGTWLSLTQATISPSLEDFQPFWQFYGLLLLHEEVLLVPPPAVHLGLCEGSPWWDLLVLETMKHIPGFCWPTPQVLDSDLVPPPLYYTVNYMGGGGWDVGTHSQKYEIIFLMASLRSVLRTPVIEVYTWRILMFLIGDLKVSSLMSYIILIDQNKVM